MNWRLSLYLCLLAFVVTLALIIGWRLSDQAMAVIIGVVAGVAASVPTSLVVGWLVLQSRSGPGRVVASTATPVPPQVIVVHATAPAPPSTASQRSLTVLPAYGTPQPTELNGLAMGSRQFTIMGGDENQD